MEQAKLKSFTLFLKITLKPHKEIKISNFFMFPILFLNNSL